MITKGTSTHDQVYTITAFTNEYSEDSLFVWERENNNEPQLANGLSSGTTISGQLSSAVDQDYYQINVGSEGTLNVAAQFPGGGASSHTYWSATVFDDTNQMIARR